MSSGARRVLVAAFGDPGHAFPAIALARALAERGHEVTVESWERWREPVEELGLGFAAAEEYRVFPPPDPDSEEGAGPADAAMALRPLLEEMRPHAVVADILTWRRRWRRRRRGSRGRPWFRTFIPCTRWGCPSSPSGCSRRGPRWGG